jgi:hypothetical protein
VGQLSTPELFHPDVTIVLEPALAARQLVKIADGSFDGGFLGWRDARDSMFTASHLFDYRLKHRDAARQQRVAAGCAERLARRADPFIDSPSRFHRYWWDWQRAAS